jgi:tetratricopeptide (TPR) repeat protein
MRLDRRLLFGAAALVLVAVTVGIGYFRVSRSGKFDAVPPTARRWYEQGSEAIREGAYTKARRELSEAVAQYDAFPVAHARLAETMSELDESGAAKNELLKVHELVPNPEALPQADRLRLAGITATVVRDFSKAAKSYSDLATLLPGRADVQVDLGRALERLGKRDDAVAAYRKAIAQDPDSAVGHLRLGVLLGESGDETGALKEFERALALYHAASNTEGEIETLLARGSWLNARNRLAASKEDLELAVRVATDTELPHQRVRSLLQLSSVLATEGRFSDAEAMAQKGVEFARTANMDGLAASSLIDFGNVLLAKGKQSDAARFFAQADEMARGSGARRTEARAALSMGSVLVSLGRPGDAIPYIERGLAFYKEGGYAQTQRIAQTLLASAYAGTGQLERSRATSEQLLTTLRAAHDNAAIAVAAERLGGVLMDMGRFVEALAAVRESLELNRAAGNQLAMPFLLTREAELLGRLGRFDEADKDLALLQTEFAAGREAFVARGAAIDLARADVANLMGDWRTAARAAASATARTSAEQVSLRLSAQVAAALARANLGRGRDAVAEARSALAGAEQAKDARLLLDIREAVVLVFDSAGDADAAYQASQIAIRATEAIPNVEASWRLHAIAALSASALKLPDAEAHRAAASRYLQMLEKTFAGQQFATYGNRPDVKQLRTRARL